LELRESRKRVEVKVRVKVKVKRRLCAQPVCVLCFRFREKAAPSGGAWMLPELYRYLHG